ncbi:hypothetical protein BFP66_06420 [Streptococcus suis]|nr:hypothetical protein BFP66_06420 [Streptococcus suis]BCK45850.1 hypothetical protein DAT300_13890 [Streptococcus suis]
MHSFEFSYKELDQDKHTKISSEEISDGRKYSLLFLYDKVEVSCSVENSFDARRRNKNWQDTCFRKNVIKVCGTPDVEY